MNNETSSDTPAANVPGRVLIFDTSLRDGEQAPGFSMHRGQKLRFARALDELGVDVLEAGFPSASPEDFASVVEVAGAMRHARVCALARCVTADIDSAARALQSARAARIHVFIATSPLHREHKLGMGKSEVIEHAVRAVEQARRHCDDVEFSAEDALRTEPQFLAEVFSAALQAGASTLNAPDTVGYTTPEEMRRLFAWLREHVPGAESAVFSAHCHDDLGLAVANSLAAVEAGARQVECTINGIGERAGNAALEEVVMALKVRGAHFGVDTGIDSRRLYPTSRLLAQLTAQPTPRNKAVVGDNAFAHESGIHQHGMLKHAGTYEIMRPEDVGFARTRMVLGKHSGRHALRQRLAALGHRLEAATMDDVFARFKALADRKKEVFDGDLEALVLGQDPQAMGPWRLQHLATSAHHNANASASITLVHEDGRSASEAAVGDGPVDAVLRAVERATGITMQVTEFLVRAVSEGGDAQGQASLEVEYDQRSWHGHGYSTDIIEAAATAALEVANRICRSLAAHPSAARKSA